LWPPDIFIYFPALVGYLRLTTGLDPVFGPEFPRSVNIWDS